MLALALAGCRGNTSTSAGKAADRSPASASASASAPASAPAPASASASASDASAGFRPHLRNDSPGLAGFARRVAEQAARFPAAFFLEAAPSDRGPAVALTFDDGPNPVSTPKLLEILFAHQAPATFFVVGSRAKRFPEVVRAMAAAGHAVAGHGYRHDELTDLDAETAYAEQIAPTQAVLAELLGAAPSFYRPPYGKVSDAQIAAFAEHDLVTVNWSIDSCDWMKGHNATDQIVATIVDNVHDGAIILFHSNRLRTTTFAALPLIIAELRRRGYALRTVPDLLGPSPAAGAGATGDQPGPRPEPLSQEP